VVFVVDTYVAVVVFVVDTYVAVVVGSSKVNIENYDSYIAKV